MLKSIRNRAPSALLLCCIAACGTPAGENIGERWYLDTDSANLVLESDKRFARLVRDAAVVDDSVVLHRFYEPDCVVYETAKRGTQVVAVCGDRTPLPVTAAPAPFKWRFEENGLVMVGSIVVHEGRAVEVIERLPIEQVLDLARKQPQFEEGWTGAPVMELFYPPIRPLTETRAPDLGPVREGIGNTALLIAVRSQNAELVEALLRAGSDPNVPNNAGVRPLMVAVGRPDGDTLIVAHLLRGGANPDLADSRGATALMHAAAAPHALAIRMLLAAGADPAIRDAEGRSARDRVPAERGEIIEILRRAESGRGVPARS